MQPSATSFPELSPRLSAACGSLRACPTGWRGHGIIPHLIPLFPTLWGTIYLAKLLCQENSFRFFEGFRDSETV